MLKVERGFLYIDNGAALKKECQKDWLRQHRLQVQMCPTVHKPSTRKTPRSHQLLVTVTVAVPTTLHPPQRPVIVAVPAATAVTVAVPPVFLSSRLVTPSTVATAELLVSQYTARPPLPSPWSTPVS